ncbi:MAG: ATP-binding protein [Gammaproteobacteria bacterium]|nr:ATP-binding protein [Gammaproteobacteria bacterium]
MMPNILERHELFHLEEWAGRASRKPLVIRGARQVGKSTLVREFARRARMTLVEINLERNPEIGQAFENADPAQVLATLSLLTGQGVRAGETLLFLDEIQAVPRALAMLRYFYEEMPGLHVVAAGSLLELALEEKGFSMPVGRIEYLNLGPMHFEDFLVAVGRPRLAEHLRTFELAGGTLPDALHRQYLGLLRQYWIVGGLPEAVAAYASTTGGPPGDFIHVARIQQNLLATYRDDFGKYSHGRLRDRMQLVFERLPAMVGRKFAYVGVSREHRAAELADALTHLCMARLAWKVRRTAANGLPLEAEVYERYFKCLTMDVGVMCAALRLNVIDLGREDLVLVNDGAVAEQFVGQHLLASGSPHETPALHYWAREARNASAEIDYVATIGHRIVPVEVKAGTTGSLRSLHQFLAEKRSDFGVRFNADTPSLLEDTRRLADGSTISYRLLSLPLYLVGQLKRLAMEVLAPGTPPRRKEQEVGESGGIPHEGDDKDDTVQ